MFIRQTRTHNKITGEGYFTFRRVRGERRGGKVRQITVLNLGRHFSVQQEDWPVLCLRLEQRLHPQDNFLPMACSEALEAAAQRYFGQRVERAVPPALAVADPVVPNGAVAADAVTPPPSAPDFQEVDIDSLPLTQPRSVGVEHRALHALTQVGLVQKLADLGINGALRAAILGNVIGRMAAPASELSTWNGLQTQSGLGELIDVDFAGLSHMRLYRASDLLIRHRAALEEPWFSSIKTLFSLEETITLYDLTNTYVEGEAAANPKAHFGRSKEKRTDGPLITLGRVLDGSGFIRRSQTFAGHVSEGATRAGMLSGLGAPPGARVIRDAGIASEANVTWLSEHGYRYLVVRRGGVRPFDATCAVSIETAGGDPLRLQKVTGEDGKEVELYGHSAGREAKETARVARFGAAFEAGLQKIADGLNKPRSEKRVDKWLERIGRLKEKSRGASPHYTVSRVADDSETQGKRATALTWVKNPVAGTMATHPGVYCLRSHEMAWDEERLWRTYTMLTDLESVFRRLKSERGLRPVFHQKEDRSDGHLFITVRAYQCVQVLRTPLKKAGINDSWATLRKTLSVQRRLTNRLRRKDGRTIHVRKSTVAEPALMAIYQALAIHPAPGGTQKLIC